MSQQAECTAKGLPVHLPNLFPVRNAGSVGFNAAKGSFVRGMCKFDLKEAMPAASNPTYVWSMMLIIICNIATLYVPNSRTLHHCAKQCRHASFDDCAK